MKRLPKKLKDLKYINLKYCNVEYVKLEHDDFLKMLSEIKDEDMTPCRTKASDYRKGKVCVEVRGKWFNIIKYDSKEHKYTMYSTHNMDNNKNTREDPFEPKHAMEAVSKKFKELNNGVSLKGAFGYVPPDEHDTVIKCTPKQLFYSVKCEKPVVCSAIDATSMFPSNTRGKMPDFRTKVVYKGTVPPSERYPFALYVKSGHSAEYGVYDSHNWTSNYFYPYLFNNERFDCAVKEEDDTTWLFKASDYEIGPVYEHFYQTKATCEPDTPEYNEAKLALNSSIGMMHKNNNKRKNNFSLYHLVVFILGRSDQVMLNMLDRICPVYVLHAAVDGIIYKGTREYGIPNKELGKFKQEFTGMKAVIKGANQYIVMDDNGELIKCKHGGYNGTISGNPIDEPSCFEDINDWCRINPLGTNKLSIEEIKEKYEQIYNTEIYQKHEEVLRSIQKARNKG